MLEYLFSKWYMWISFFCYIFKFVIYFVLNVSVYKVWGILFVLTISSLLFLLHLSFQARQFIFTPFTFFLQCHPHSYRTCMCFEIRELLRWFFQVKDLFLRWIHVFEISRNLRCVIKVGLSSSLAWYLITSARNRPRLESAIFIIIMLLFQLHQLFIGHEGRTMQWAWLGDRYWYLVGSLIVTVSICFKNTCSNLRVWSVFLWWWLLLWKVVRAAESKSVSWCLCFWFLHMVNSRSIVVASQSWWRNQFIPWIPTLCQLWWSHFLTFIQIIIIFVKFFKYLWPSWFVKCLCLWLWYVASSRRTRWLQFHLVMINSIGDIVIKFFYLRLLLGKAKLLLWFRHICGKVEVLALFSILLCLWKTLHKLIHHLNLRRIKVVV